MFSNTIHFKFGNHVSLFSRSKNTFALIMLVTMFLVGCDSPDQNAVATHSVHTNNRTQFEVAPTFTEPSTVTNDPASTPIPSPTNSLSPLSTSNWQEYNSASDPDVYEFLDAQFSVKFPQGWETGWFSDSGVNAFIISSGDVADTFYKTYTGPSVIILHNYFQSSPEVDTLYEWAQWGEIMESPWSTSINGQDAARTVYIERNEIRIAVWIVKENANLMMVASAPLEEKNEAKPIFEAIINSVVIGLENQEPSPTPNEELEATPTPDEIETPQELYDGTFFGTTSQGKDFKLTITDNGIQEYFVDFDIPGCETETPMSAWMGSPVPFQGNQFVFTDHNITISGTFTSTVEVGGMMLVTPIFCDNEAKLTWYARSDSIPPTPAPPDFAWNLVPDLEIPDELFFPELGITNLDEYAGNVMVVDGDWMIYRNTMQSILPIPLGWATRETGQRTLIATNLTDETGQRDILIEISYAFSEVNGGPATSEEYLQQIETSLVDKPTLDLLAREVTDDARGYVLIHIMNEEGKNVLVLQYISRYENNPSGDFFHVFTAYVYEDKWDIYFPIIQAMLENWASYDGHLLGSTLPDALGE